MPAPGPTALGPERKQRTLPVRRVQSHQPSEQGPPVKALLVQTPKNEKLLTRMEKVRELLQMIFFPFLKILFKSLAYMVSQKQMMLSIIHSRLHTLIISLSIA